jgi:hypothetical protein
MHMPSVLYAEFQNQVHYAECHYTECIYAECHGVINSAIFIQEIPFQDN